jgi:hypothetical protein
LFADLADVNWRTLLLGHLLALLLGHLLALLSGHVLALLAGLLGALLSGDLGASLKQTKKTNLRFEFNMIENNNSS